MLLACSPAICTSAVMTGPQVTLSRNGRHSTTDAPAALVCWGSATRNAPDVIRRPSEPVSTTMPSIIWQVDVPGMQTVTVTNGSLNALLTGPPFTTSATVLFVAPELE